jgi:hypothetical protein
MSEKQACSGRTPGGHHPCPRAATGNDGLCTAHRAGKTNRERGERWKPTVEVPAQAARPAKGRAAW